MPIPLISNITQQNNGTYYLYRDKDGYSGFQVRTDHADRDSIPAGNRNAGMLIYTQSDGYFWQLGTSLSNGSWTQPNFPNDIVFAGDLSGTHISQIVMGLQGRAVSSAAPTDGYVLTWDQADGYWHPAILPSSSPIGTAGGDLSGTYPNPLVAKLQGRAVSSAAPNDGDILTYITADLRWEPKPLSTLTPTGPAGGDLTGTYPNPTVISLSGSGTNPDTGVGTIVQSVATFHRVAAGSDYETYACYGKIQSSSSSTYTTFAVIPVDNNAEFYIDASFQGRDSGNGGNHFAGKLSFTAERHGGSSVVVDPATTTIIDPHPSAVPAGGYDFKYVASGNNVILQVRGLDGSNPVSWKGQYTVSKCKN